MANVNLYVLYDDEAQTVTGTILMSTRHAAAARSFRDICNNKETLPGQYPEHFRLLHVGCMSTDTGEITENNVPPVTVTRGTDIARDLEDRHLASLRGPGQ